MSFSISEEAKKRVEELKDYYPDKKSAVMPLLYIAQEENGHITDQAVEWISQEVGISPVHVKELISFYTMYTDKPRGKYHIQVCRTLSCAVLGAKTVVNDFSDKLGIKLNEVSEDGMWSIEEVECLGSCGTAPMCQINETYFENLNSEKISDIIIKINETKPDLSFSTIKDEMGKGLDGYSKSEICSNCKCKKEE